jgi:hypothetical protein
VTSRWSIKEKFRNGRADKDLDNRRTRAYEIYLERGGDDGRALDDWLQAEMELEKSYGGEAARRKKK